MRGNNDCEIKVRQREEPGADCDVPLLCDMARETPSYAWLMMHLLPQAELMEFRVAWLEADQARLKAIKTRTKLEEGKALLTERKRQLEESQAPIKCALSSAKACR